MRLISHRKTTTKKTKTTTTKKDLDSTFDRDTETEKIREKKKDF